jgi:hypothetical protein
MDRVTNAARAEPVALQGAILAFLIAVLNLVGFVLDWGDTLVMLINVVLSAAVVLGATIARQFVTPVSE